MRRRLPVLLFLPLAGCYPALELPEQGPRARLILAPTEQLADGKQPPGIYIYENADTCTGIIRPAYPPPAPHSNDRPYVIPAGQPIAIGWYSDFSGRVSLGATPGGIVVPKGAGTSRMCANTLTFTPADGETYRVSDARQVDGCQFSVTDSAGRPVPFLRREMWPEARQHAHCEGLSTAAPAR